MTGTITNIAHFETAEGARRLTELLAASVGVHPSAVVVGGRDDHASVDPATRVVQIPGPGEDPTMRHVIHVSAHEILHLFLGHAHRPVPGETGPKQYARALATNLIADVAVEIDMLKSFPGIYRDDLRRMVAGRRATEANDPWRRFFLAFEAALAAEVLEARDGHRRKLGPYRDALVDDTIRAVRARDLNSLIEIILSLPPRMGAAPPPEPRPRPAPGSAGPRRTGEPNPAEGFTTGNRQRNGSVGGQQRQAADAPIRAAMKAYAHHLQGREFRVSEAGHRIEGRDLPQLIAGNANLRSACPWRPPGNHVLLLDGGDGAHLCAEDFACIIAAFKSEFGPTAPVILASRRVDVDSEVAIEDSFRRVTGSPSSSRIRGMLPDEPSGFPLVPFLASLSGRDVRSVLVVATTGSTEGYGLGLGSLTPREREQTRRLLARGCSVYAWPRGLFKTALARVSSWGLAGARPFPWSSP